MTDDQFWDPSLRPIADVGVRSVTLKKKADSDGSDSEPDSAIGEPEPLDDPAADGLLAAGFRLKGGAWVRR